jgi:hypothetical protein
MDMGEITRQELDAKMEAIKAWGDARFAEQRAYIDTRFAEQRAYMDARFAFQEAEIAALGAKVDTRFVEQDAKLQKQLLDIVKWMIGTAVGLFAVGITTVGIMLNVAVNAITAMPADDSGASNSSAHYAPVRSLHRFKRHHQSGAGSGDTRRHELHAGVAQVFHPE